MGLKQTLVALLPDAWIDSYRLRKGGIVFSGDYPSWAEASRVTLGYDADVILERVRSAMRQVRDGGKVYERDSVLFDIIEHPWPLLAALLRIAALNGNRLEIVDFGGSLGTTYFQCRSFLSVLDSLRWHIVEQENFVRAGKEEFETEELRFHFDLPACLDETRPQVVLFSGVLHCLEEPFAPFEAATAVAVPHILIDRTPFIAGDRDILTVEKVPPKIYDASYPCWFFSEQRFRARMPAHYRVLAEFDARDGRMQISNGVVASFKGLILERTEPAPA
jgi:putative methyltransferase (TIGR04325 family)